MLKVLWVTNTIFPDAAAKLGLTPPVFGGWMYGLCRDLRDRRNGLTVAVATVVEGEQLQWFQSNDVTYYCLPREKDGRKVAEYWSQIINDFSPDLVHIHGTEFEHGLLLMRAFPGLKYIVSIQGLISLCYRYYLHGLSFFDIVSSITLRDIVRGDTLFQAKSKFLKRGCAEREYIERADMILGRTEWDFVHVNAIRQNVLYRHCDESLRDVFYDSHEWLRDNCEEHSIFISQAGYPLKGLHQVLKAMPFLIKEFPKLKLSVAGPNFFSTQGIISKLKIGGYAKYIRHLISCLNLYDRVFFLGPLNESKMRDAYLKAHVFVCPSSIENSPNSLGEAQILGVPVVAAYCGGIPSMVRDGESALLYRFEEPEMLAAKIKSVFSSSDLASRLSRNGSEEAWSRHDRVKNVEAIERVYTSMSISRNWE